MSQRILIIPGPASAQLGRRVCETLGVAPTAYDCHRFPDGETQVEIGDSVRGADVFLIQSTSPPVEQHLIELVLLGDACRRAGASRMTAVIPYFGYARQDRRIARRALGARVAADVIATGGFDRLMLIDAHTPAIEGFCRVPIDHLTAVPLLTDAVRPLLRDGTVVVAPDLGAVKRAREYARVLQVPLAIVHKTRLDGEEVEAHAVIGEVRGRSPLIVDDMLSTGATIEAAVGALRASGAAEPVLIAVTHALLVGRAPDALPRLALANLVATDTVAFEPVANVPLEVVSVAPLIATAIERDHRDESLADLRA